VNFRSFNFDPRIAAGLDASGFKSPTPVQSQSIPLILEGRDVMALAQTGTGKTAAFVLPGMQRLLSSPRRGLRMLVIAPTRELVEQINQVISVFARSSKLRSITLYGGVSIQPQIHGLRRGVDIAVACPGRLLDHLRRGTIDLSKVEVLVLDEADRMFDMGFLPNIRQIVKSLPDQRQSLFFSATMPKDVRLLAKDILRNPETVEVQHTTPIATVSHAIYPVDSILKTSLIIKLLDELTRESVLIFTRTKHRAKKLAQSLARAGHQVASLQGDLTQNKRQEALNGFRSGKYRVLVATDIAARGIDVSSISHVINYDVPDTADAYVHRIGRTGRAAKTGDAFSLVTSEDADIVRSIERFLGRRLKRLCLPGFDYKGTPSPRLQQKGEDPRPRHRRTFREERVSPHGNFDPYAARRQTSRQGDRPHQSESV